MNRLEIIIIKENTTKNPPITMEAANIGGLNAAHHNTKRHITPPLLDTTTCMFYCYWNLPESY